MPHKLSRKIVGTNERQTTRGKAVADAAKAQCGSKSSVPELAHGVRWLSFNIKLVRVDGRGNARLDEATAPHVLDMLLCWLQKRVIDVHTRRTVCSREPAHKNDT